MIISKTPFRISFFGGGSDYPDWYRENSGAVLSTTIDKYCYISCRKLPQFFDHKYKVVYSIIEQCISLDDIKHPVVPAVIKYLKIKQGIEIHHDADLPARSGMGSSSSFIVGLLHALHAFKGHYVSDRELLYQSLEIEQDLLNECVGSQDQANAVYGGFNHIQFMTSGEILINPVTISQNKLREFNDNLLLIYTGISRRASDIAESYVPSLSNKYKQIVEMQGLLKNALEVFSSDGCLDDIGKLLHESWVLKRSLSQSISSVFVDDMYNIALNNGALGGKILGAGGGGFLLLYAPKERHKKIITALGNIRYVPFNFERYGTKIIHYQGE